MSTSHSVQARPLANVNRGMRLEGRTSLSGATGDAALTADIANLCQAGYWHQAPQVNLNFGGCARFKQLQVSQNDARDTPATHPPRAHPEDTHTVGSERSRTRVA